MKFKRDNTKLGIIIVLLIIIVGSFTIFLIQNNNNTGKAYDSIDLNDKKHENLEIISENLENPQITFRLIDDIGSFDWGRYSNHCCDSTPSQGLRVFLRDGKYNWFCSSFCRTDAGEGTVYIDDEMSIDFMHWLRVVSSYGLTLSVIKDKD